MIQSGHLDFKHHLTHDKAKGLLDECDGSADPVALLRRTHSVVHVPFLASRCVTYIDDLGLPGDDLDDREVKTVACQRFHCFF